MMKLLLLLLFVNLSYTQIKLETKEFIIFKNKEQNQIDLSKYIDTMDGKYELKIISVDNINYEKDKKILVELCDFKVDLFFNNILRTKKDSSKD